jgi:hypothetical protein
MKKLTYLVLALALTACQKSETAHGFSGTKSGAIAERNASSEPVDKRAADSARRFLALKHRLVLLIPAASLTEQFRTIQAECLKAGCEILSAGEEAESAGQYANATLVARVPPAAFTMFFTGLQTHGKLLSHYSESEDKTAEVIDVEARIKNLEALKARVLELLAKNAGSIKDLLEAEKQLAETQAALDSINGQRRALASQTDMIRVEIELRPQSLRTEGSWTAPVAMAAHEAGDVLMKSVAFLLTAAVAVLPWALVFGLVILPLFRKWRRRRAATLASDAR